MTLCHILTVAVSLSFWLVVGLVAFKTNQLLMGNVIQKSFFASNYMISSHHHHYHHVVLLARISLTLSRHFSYHSSLLAGLQGYILYPHIAAVCMFELVVLLLLGLMRGSIGVHHWWVCPLLLQQCPACLARLTCIVFVMGSRWPYSWCLVGCCRHDLTNDDHLLTVVASSSYSEYRVFVTGRETGVHTKTQKWYLRPPCLTLSIIVCNSGKE